ncbi:hypothetical protein HY256_02715 [Candidatus Sumerlaeota bacterium]|nr:hypothetical protein [Candidatus Sumerlaeota bacterium]
MRLNQVRIHSQTPSRQFPTFSLVLVLLLSSIAWGQVPAGVGKADSINLFLFFPPNLAPDIIDPGDQIVGDRESGDQNNVFVFPDAFDLDALAADDNTPDSGILWSYFGTGKYILNGVPPMTGADNADVPGAKELRSQDLDRPAPNGHPKSGGGTQDSLGRTVTIRNNDLSPGPGLGPYPDPPGGAGVLAAETQVITLAASDGATHTLQSFLVYTANDTSDSLSDQMYFLGEHNFESDPNSRTGWLPMIFGGATAGTTGTGTGLCMWVPLTNTPSAAVYWYSPNNASTPYAPGFVTLIDSTVYRVRVEMYSDQTAVGRIPFWTFGYNNVFYTPTYASNIYGGDFGILDVAGGANGIGRPQGRTSYDFWFCPNPMLTRQWRGQDTWSASFSPFNPSYDNRNDINLSLRILDGNQGAGGILNQNDTGTICLKRLRVDSIYYSKLSQTLLYAPPICDTTHAIIPDTVSGTGGGYPAAIDCANQVANFSLGPDIQSNPNGPRKRLIFYDALAGGPTLRNWPLPASWRSDELLMLKTRIRSNVGGPAGTVEGTDPINVILHDWDTPTYEITSAHFSQKGTAGNMKWAASPRLLATTGSAQGEDYVSFMYTQNRTATLVVPNADRIRGYPDFINNSLIGNSTDGRDPFTVESMELYRIDTTPFP